MHTSIGLCPITHRCPRHGAEMLQSLEHLPFSKDLHRTVYHCPIKGCPCCDAGPAEFRKHCDHRRIGDGWLRLVTR